MPAGIKLFPLWYLRFFSTRAVKHGFQRSRTTAGRLRRRTHSFALEVSSKDSKLRHKKQVRQSISHPTLIRAATCVIDPSLSCSRDGPQPDRVPCDEYDCGDGYTNLGGTCENLVSRRLQSTSDLCFDACCEEGELKVLAWLVCSRRRCVL